jgi:hypothetical protein
MERRSGNGDAWEVGFNNPARERSTHVRFPARSMDGPYVSGLSLTLRVQPVQILQFLHFRLHRHCPARRPNVLSES